MTLREHIEKNHLKTITVEGYERKDGSELRNIPIEELTEEELNLKVSYGFNDFETYDEWFHRSIS